MKNLNDKIEEAAEKFSTGEYFKLDEFTLEKVAIKSYRHGASFAKGQMLSLPNDYVVWLMRNGKIPKGTLTFGDFEDFLKENPL